MQHVTTAWIAAPALGSSTLPTLLAAVVAVHLAVIVVHRPQRGLLVLAALLPFDGLLLIIPGGDAVGPWKEGLLAVTLLASLVAPRSARGEPLTKLPAWVPAAVVFVALGAVSAISVGGILGTWGFKIDFLYVAVPIVLWRCPFDERERDRLVSILMVTGAITAVFGLVQQVLGAPRLNALGWEYNTVIRFSGGLLRSFSTFTQPFSFGLFITLVLLVCLPVAMADHRRPRNLAFLVASPVLVLGMAASVVRGATLGLLAGLLVLMVWRFRGLFHALVPGALALLLVPASVITAYFSSSSLDERTTGWSTIIRIVAERPLGNGIGTTGAAAAKSLELGADPAGLITTSGTELYLPDNLYIKTVLELGPLGLWVLLLLGATVISAAVAASRRTFGNDRALAQGIAASVVGAAAASTVSTYLEIFPLDFYFWLLVGVLLCLDRTSSSTRSPSVPGEAASRPTSASSSVP
ncbi:hypothetical protein BH11ACT8_BH11ACT8_34430 [soil metagenome]